MPELRRAVHGLVQCMIRLQAIVNGRRATMLTGEFIDEAAASCRDRFGARFEGFDPIPPETKARSVWGEYRAKRMSRDQVEAWLAEQGDEAEIRAELNRIRRA